MTSWRTTAMGWLAIVAGVVKLAMAFIDGDPTTTASFEDFAMLFSVGAAGAGLIMAKDDKK